MTFKNLTRFQAVQVGGSFSVLKDIDGKILVWGANTNGEMGLGDT